MFVLTGRLYKCNHLFMFAHLKRLLFLVCPVLRLHKYACLFTGMCYQQMLNMTEQDLEHRNITKGARQKLILSIEKLKARCTVLVASEHRLLQPPLAHCTHHHAPVPYKLLHQVLFQIRAFLSTPIPPQELATDGDSIGTNRHEPSCSLAMLFARTPTDLNNNSSSISNRNHRHHEHNDQLVDYSSCMGVWLSLWQQQPWTPSHQQHNDTQLVIVMTRLVGHGENRTHSCESTVLFCLMSEQTSLSAQISVRRKKWVLFVTLESWKVEKLFTVPVVQDELWHSSVDVKIRWHDYQGYWQHSDTSS